MIISRAEVRDRFDPDRNQRFRAKIESLGGAEKWINFTSPYATNGTAGLVGHVPVQGTTVLVVQPDGGNGEWYYLAATFDQEPINWSDGPKDKLASEVPPSQRVTDITGKTGAGTGTPNRIVLSDYLGNSLGLYSEKRGKGEQNIKTELKTPTGKRIALVDSRATDAIIIDVGSKTGQAKITLGDDDPQNDRIPANSYELVTTGPQQHFNYESQTDMYVMDGRELQIVNKSKGTNATPNDERFGNVNIQSDMNDVNIFSKQPYVKESPNTIREATDGRIFIETLNTDGYHQVIQIQTHGQGHDINDDGVDENTCVIRIKSSGKIEISSQQDMDFDCGGTINMKAAQDVNIAAGNNVNIVGGPAINAQAGEIQLNPPGSVTEASPVIGNDDSHYGTEGVTTY